MDEYKALVENYKILKYLYRKKYYLTDYCNIVLQIGLIDKWDANFDTKYVFPKIYSDNNVFHFNAKFLPLYKDENNYIIFDSNLIYVCIKGREGLIDGNTLHFVDGEDVEVSNFPVEFVWNKEEPITSYTKHVEKSLILY